MFEETLRQRIVVGPLVNQGGLTITDEGETAAILNSYSTSVFIEESQNDIPEPEQVFIGPEEDKLHNVDFHQM